MVQEFKKIQEQCKFGKIQTKRSGAYLLDLSFRTGRGSQVARVRQSPGIRFPPAFMNGPSAIQVTSLPVIRVMEHENPMPRKSTLL